MHKTTARKKHAHHEEYDLHGDLERIKAALFDTTYDMKGIAGDMISDSWENVKERSTELQDNVKGYAADKPARTIGLALLAGVLIGFFIRK